MTEATATLRAISFMAGGSHGLGSRPPTARNCRWSPLACSAMTYTRHERARAIAWKKRTDSLPPEAKLPAPYVGKSGVPNGPAYEFCLPPGHEKLNLLADVRPQALTLFAELRVPWHAGVNGGPSNHLLSSQVQCVNAL